MILQTRIAELRKALDLSQERLAERIGVSRQAVAKWEAGETLPELEHLIRLGKLFSVSIDSLLTDEDPCAAATGPEAPEPNAAVIDFLCRAKRATYAGHGPEAAPTRPGSHDLSYRAGDFFYHDSYLGGERFSGEEAVWNGEAPIWSMNYCGRVLHPSFSGDFLKEALAQVAEGLPFRGPAVFLKGELSYRCMVWGDFDWFRGSEEILAGGVRTYECVFHGGSVG